MTPSDHFRINPKIVNATIDGEVIMLNLERGRYYSLTASGAETWSALERSGSIGEILEHLRARYDGPALVLEGALLRFLNELRDEELILPSTAEDRDADAGSPASGTEVPALSERRPFEPPMLHAYTDMEDLLLLDPIHEVDGTGWPNRVPGNGSAET